MRMRIPAESSEYYLPKNTYLATYYYAHQYPDWMAELRKAPDSGKGIDYARERVQTSTQYDATAELAMRRHELKQKTELIEDVAEEVAPGFSRWLLKGVTEETTFERMASAAGQRFPTWLTPWAFYLARRRFYYILAGRLGYSLQSTQCARDT